MAVRRLDMLRELKAVSVLRFETVPEPALSEVSEVSAACDVETRHVRQAGGPL